MRIKHLIILILFLTSTIYYYNITLPKPSLITAKVTKITDGDTIILNDSTKIRLLGINTPESNQPYHQEAKDFLSSKVQNQTIQIESHGQDKYSRTLAYIFLDSQNINSAILKQGLASLYYYETDLHFEELKASEEFARENQLGIWKKSPNSACIKILEFKTQEPESLILQNSCPYKISLTYKDDATHHYSANLSPNQIHQNNFSHIWNDDGDSIYIYDNQGLIYFYRY